MNRVLVTGSTRGIGLAIAHRLKKDGYTITFHGRAESPHSKMLDENIIYFDISNESETRKILEDDIKKNGAFYGVVCSAGMNEDSPFPSMTQDSWKRVIDSNLGGFYNVLNPLVMPMIQLRTGGRIVVLSSIAGILGNRGQVNYSAAKAGLIGASKALSRELAKRKITVNCVAPGFIQTDMTVGLEEHLESIPMKRFGKPEEVAEAVAYLFNPFTEYMTGQTLVLSGGIG